MNLNFTIEPLDRTDKLILKRKIRSLIVLYLLILFPVSIIFSIVFMFMSRQKLLNDENELLFILFSIISIVIYLYFLVKNLKGPYVDILSNEKKVKVGIVQEKFDHTNYGWTGNIVADMRHQPKLLEYYLIINDIKYFANKEDFDKIDKGDQVELQFSSSTTELLRIKKRME